MPDTDAVSESLRIAADPETLYTILGDFETYPTWLSEFRSAEVVAHRDDGWADQVRYRLGAVGIEIDMTLAYAYEDDRITWHLVEGDMLTRLDGSYVLAAEDDGTTTLTYALEVVSTIPLPGMVRRRLAVRIVKDSLRAIRHRAEAA